jgi:hypothetical protein
MMLELVNAPVNVEVQMRRDGTARPLAFSWRRRRYEITAWGREETVTREDRTVRCYLVQTEGFESWELCQDTETTQWTLARHWARKYRAV